MDEQIIIHNKFKSLLGGIEHEQTIICDPPWENREQGERTVTRAMTQHTKRVTNLMDMHIFNKKNKECHGRYCFAC